MPHSRAASFARHNPIYYSYSYLHTRRLQRTLQAAPRPGIPLVLLKKQRKETTKRIKYKADEFSRETVNVRIGRDAAAAKLKRHGRIIGEFSFWKSLSPPEAFPQTTRIQLVHKLSRGIRENFFLRTPPPFFFFKK